MLLLLIGYGVEFLIQTAFLLVALLIMIKIQKLDFNFPGLLGAAALASLLETIIQNVTEAYLGTYLACSITSVIVCPVLLFCIAKVTQADSVDVCFTVFVGYALQFGMNLFLLGALMGDLRPSARHADSFDEGDTDAAVAMGFHEPDTDTAAAVTNQVKETAKVSRNPSSKAGSPESKPFPAAGPKETTTAPAKPAGDPKPRASGRGAEIVRGFALKSVTKNANNSMAMFSTGTKTYTIFVGETISVQTPNGGTLRVRCEAVDDNSALLSVDGEGVSLMLE